MVASSLILGSSKDDLQNKLALSHDTASTLQADLQEQTSSNVALTALLGTAAQKESHMEEEINKK